MIEKVTNKIKEQAKKEIKESINPKIVGAGIFLGFLCASNFLEKKPNVIIINNYLNDRFKDILGIHSPSKDFINSWNNLQMEGINYEKQNCCGSANCSWSCSNHIRN